MTELNPVAQIGRIEVGITIPYGLKYVKVDNILMVDNYNHVKVSIPHQSFDYFVMSQRTRNRRATGNASGSDYAKALQLLKLFFAPIDIDPHKSII